jgi:hypothetical protein
MSDHCFLDTTVLVEALLKSAPRRRRARSATRQFSTSTLPVYAIKELKTGALTYFVWLHNRLAESGSVAQTYLALARNMRQPNRVSTGLEALAAASSVIVGTQLASAENKSETDRLQAQLLTLEIRRLILRGWADRRKITSRVDGELACFPEDGPYYDDATGMMFLPNRRCPKGKDCSYAPGLRVRRGDLEKLLTTIKDQNTREDNRRRAALHTLKNTPKRPFEDEDCISLGDAYFALHCPQDAAILTSNIRHHRSLAEPLGRPVIEYIP